MAFEEFQTAKGLSDLGEQEIFPSPGTQINRNSWVASLVYRRPRRRKAVPSSSIPPASRATDKSELVRLSSGRMVVTFDRRNGTLYSLSEAHDRLGTNFLGNSDNTLGIKSADTHWTGDVVTTIWELKTAEWIREQESFVPYRISGRWKRESTLASPDIRQVGFDGKVFAVHYRGRSEREDGIQSYSLSMSYRFSDDGALLWDLEFENTTDRTLEFGELAFPLRANDDYAEPYSGATSTMVNTTGKLAAMQKIVHEQKVLCHWFVAGHSSYALLQRPRGDAPFLLFHCLQDTSFECIYKTPAQGRRLDRDRSVRGALQRRQRFAELGLESLGERAFFARVGAWSKKVIPHAICVSR
jgi:hypothetical protein